MAQSSIDTENEERIVDIDVSEELETSFLEYAYSVIYTRALPDARDGLKPVQRRILYSMSQMGIYPDKSHVKCARVVGQVMGVLHPHGDQAIYDALVRLGQPWAMRLPLIDSHGNFGSLDAGPAAMRYTECRMAPPSSAITNGLNEDTVDFRPNYDGKESEPAVLPAAFPNLLVNGATGIAVGMATNIAPHNLIEVVAALKHLLKDPDASTETLMRFIPGPDLPTGGKIIGLDGIREAYETGRGSFKIRATTRIEKVSPRRQGIVITQLPYMIGPEKIIEQIKTGVDNKKLIGIADVKDLTDLANGTRLVIEVKNGINPEVLLQQLYKVTKLEDSFAINAVALVEGQPRTLSLKELLTVYLNYRLEITLRRTHFQLNKAKDRLHLVEGLLIAIIDIDDVIAIIRSSEDVSQARERLTSAFELTETQANYILDMQLRRLTKFSKIELESEANKLRDRITELTEIIENDSVLRDLVSDELSEVSKLYGTPRRTVLLESSGIPQMSTAPLEIADGPSWVMLSSSGLIARIDTEENLTVHGPRTSHDVIVSVIRTTSQSEFGLITNKGRLIKARAIELPTVPFTANSPNLSGGSRVSELWNLEPDEEILTLTTLGANSHTLALGTRNGIVKRLIPETLNKDSWEIIRLDDQDLLVGAIQLTDALQELVFITTDAKLLHFTATQVRPQGRSGGGITGIKLSSGAKVLWFGALDPNDAEVVTVAGSSTALPGTEIGNAKVTLFSEYPSKGRATGGVRCHRLLKGEDCLVTAYAGAIPVYAAAGSGAPIDLPPQDLRRDGSGVPVVQPIDGMGSIAYLHTKE